MGERRIKTGHIVRSDKGDLDLLLVADDTARGIRLSNWQSVRSDDHGTYLLFAQISALGLDAKKMTADADVVTEIFIPKGLMPGFLQALRPHAFLEEGTEADEPSTIDSAQEDHE